MTASVFRRVERNSVDHYDRSAACYPHLGLLMFPLSKSEQVHRWAWHLHQIQRNRLVAWGVALSGILLATLIRWAIGGYVLDRIAFTTYYPAILVFCAGWENQPRASYLAIRK